MAKKKIKPSQEKLVAWIDARKRHRLSHAQVQMARELGLNPKKFPKYDNHRQERWKIPLPHYIEHLYFKSFRKERPDVVLAIEEKMRQDEEKKARKREAKLQRRQAEAAEQAEPEAGSA